MTVGLVVMAYGTPASPDDVETYYTHVRRGRAPDAELLADLRRRYDAIGGISPLRQRTEAQRSAIDTALSAMAPGRFTTALGMKHAAPFIEDAVTDLIRQGVDAMVGLVLAPHYSAMSVGEYEARLAAAAADGGLGSDAVGCLRSWHDLDAYIGFLAQAVRSAGATLAPDHRVVFTAHSLPERILDAGDRYPDELAATARLVGDAAGLDDDRWNVAWQSAARGKSEPWLGPDVLEVLEAEAAGAGRDMLVCPAGFVSDHLEVLYDLDIEAATRARSRGLRFARTAVPNDDESVMTALAEAAVAVADAVESDRPMSAS
ncbi:MAG TPA: ferrochelatase [Acidimicrobiales bacterium]